MFIYLESIDVNGDEYQNIEISSDIIANSAETATDNNININDSNQTSK